ncbi:MAG: NAD(P)H-dependent oxidoreductase [Lachnospiraceae bacterium]|nr:NAD(P)H-dependent oxidoreductase [Lachnospiraceae bacterium]
MNILIVNGSPTGKNSITLCTLRYIKKHFPDHKYKVLHVGQQIRKMETDKDFWTAPLKAADLVIFCYPVYTFLVPSQLHRFVEMMKESGIDFTGKYATQVSTSLHFYDITAHNFIEENCADMGFKVIRGLSADMEDLLHDKGQKEALSFFEFVLWNIKKGFSQDLPQVKKPVKLKKTNPVGKVIDAKAPKRIVIVADYSNSTDNRLENMCERLKNVLPCETEIVNIAEFPFTGGCLGCFNCAADGKCIYKDGFDSFLRDNIQTADATVYAYTIKDHSMGYRFKMFDDRQFCNGHRTVTMGKPVGYLVDGNLDAEENLRLLMEARAQVGGNTLAGVASNQYNPDKEIDKLAESLCYIIDKKYLPPKNFYGVGGMKIFRDLIWQMQGLMREDHKFYKKHKFYDFPQKKKGAMLAMYLVGGMMRNPKLKKKMNGKMTDGMLMPFKKVIKDK